MQMTALYEVSLSILDQILFKAQLQLCEILVDSVNAILVLPFARNESSCVVMFGKESQLAVVCVVMQAIVYRRAFACYSEGAFTV
jgi:hypothetical protein